MLLELYLTLAEWIKGKFTFLQAINGPFSYLHITQAQSGLWTNYTSFGSH